MSQSPFAGLLPTESDLVDLSKLLSDYETRKPDPKNISERVSFGTSGHRGSSFQGSFNEDHIVAVTEAVCRYRKSKGINGPLFLGFDTHALSLPAFRTALEVLAAHEVQVMIAKDLEFTPTPVISHAILVYNQSRETGLADGIVITPSHNPPESGGIKYNAVHGGPAEGEITTWIEKTANELLENRLAGIKRISYEKALQVTTTQAYDYIRHYVSDLDQIIDMDLLRNSQIKMGVDPLGGAGVNFWQPIAEFYHLNLTVLNPSVDPTFRFMTRDTDGQIRMDPSSKFVMKSVIEKSSAYDITFACDTDHDRHGIVTKSSGLMPANHYLATCIHYLFKNRPLWMNELKIGKTLVSSQMIDRVAASLPRFVDEVPVGFKWFVDGLLHGTLGFAGEESAGASFLNRNGKVWTTDKDAFVPALLSAEMTAKTGKDPAQIYQTLTAQFGNPIYSRIEAPANLEVRNKLKKISAQQITTTELAGEKIERILTEAPANQAALGGVKAETKNGWFAARPSGTEDVYKIYAESFLGQQHLDLLLKEAQAIVDQALKSSV